MASKPIFMAVAAVNLTKQLAAIRLLLLKRTLLMALPLYGLRMVKGGQAPEITLKKLLM